jgi:ABC-type polysaccharide/polyol phosphate export permease
VTAIAVTPPAAPAKRINPVAGLRQTGTLVWRSLVQIKHNPMELLDLSIQPIMFVLLFAYIFGPPMKGSVHAYLPILIPGIIVQNALFATMTTGFGLNVDVTKGVYDRFRSLPIARIAPLAGRIVADMVKQAWSMAILLLVGIIIGFRVQTNWFNIIPAFLLLIAFALFFVWISVFIGLVVTEPEKVQIFGFTVIFPITFTSNAFVPAGANFPTWLSKVIEYNPVSQMADALRGLLIGKDTAGHHEEVLSPAINAILWGLALAAIFIPLAMRAFKTRI